MNGFDVLVLVVVGVSAILAFARGFVREVLSMAALAIGILAVLWGLPIFREPVRGVIEPGWIADTVTVIGLFLLVYIAVRVLTGRIHEWVHDSEPLGILDRTAGILFGVARGFAIMALGVLVITTIAKKELLPRFLTTSSFYPFLVITGNVLQNLAPDASKTASDMAKEATEAGEELAVWRGINAIDDLKTKAKDGVSAQSKDKTAKQDKKTEKPREERPNSLKIESGK